MFVYKLSGYGFKSSCSHLNFRFRACFEQRLPWQSGKYWAWIHSETRTWHDKNIQSGILHLWRTASFKCNCWLAFFSCVANFRRKENQAEENRYLIWTADWSGEYNTPRYTEYTYYLLISNCSNDSYFLNWRYTVFIRKPFFCLRLNFLNIILEIRLRFS